MTHHYFIFVLSAHIGSGQIMGWGEKAIEVRSVETGLLDGVFMHKRAQTFRFLCERNEKVSMYTWLQRPKGCHVTQSRALRVVTRHSHAHN